MLVVDASFAVEASLVRGGLERLAGHGAVAPGLLWSEVHSALHELLWRRSITTELADLARAALARAPMQRQSPAGLAAEAWAVADRLGWAKTYATEYVALARLRRCPLLTLDSRLARGAAGEVEIFDLARL